MRTKDNHETDNLARVKGFNAKKQQWKLEIVGSGENIEMARDSEENPDGKHFDDAQGLFVMCEEWVKCCFKRSWDKKAGWPHSQRTLPISFAESVEDSRFFPKKCGGQEEGRFRYRLSDDPNGARWELYGKEWPWSSWTLEEKEEILDEPFELQVKILAVPRSEFHLDDPNCNFTGHFLCWTLRIGLAVRRFGRTWFLSNFLLFSLDYIINNHPVVPQNVPGQIHPEVDSCLWPRGTVSLKLRIHRTY